MLSVNLKLIILMTTICKIFGNSIPRTNTEDKPRLVNEGLLKLHSFISVRKMLSVDHIYDYTLRNS